MKYYLTHGYEGIFPGGWTEVEAPDMETAIMAFRAYHPDETPGLVNCAGIYAEEQFKATGMGQRGSNFGHGCWERIEIKREVKEG